MLRPVFMGCTRLCSPQVRSIKRWVAPTLRELERRRKKQGPLPEQLRSTYLEWNYDAELYAFVKRLREEFDEELLRTALTHRTYVVAQESTEKNLVDNQALIVEGELFISKRIRGKFEKVYLPDAVDAIHAHLTSESMLAHVASHMGTNDLILTSEYPPAQSTYANTFKAVVAALKQTSEDRAAKFVDDFLICQLKGKELFDVWEPKRPYEYLLGLLKERGVSEIEPRLCNKSAINTILANYQVGLYDDQKQLLGIGWGESPATAKETAALDAIHRLQQNILKLT